MPTQQFRIVRPHDRDAHLYRLAQANKMIRLSEVNEDVPDGPIVPDPVDFAAVTGSAASLDGPCHPDGP